jgi:hypothetical protein
MRKRSNEGFIPTNVLIEFEDGPVSFRVSREATLADISENLDKIARWHRGEPISINVRFKAPNHDDSGRDRGHSLISSPISQLHTTEQSVRRGDATEALLTNAVTNEKGKLL